MKIDSLAKGLYPFSGRVEPGGSRAGKERGSNRDTVAISEHSQLRTEAYREALSAPDIRLDKVRAIKEQIMSGEYVIDTRKIAEKLVREELELFL